ncbi:MAG: thiamine ABC transporter substrate-binding protein [Anaerolineae bacterium]
MKRFLLLLVCAVFLLGGRQSTRAQGDETLRLVTYDSFAISEEVQTQFEQETGITLEIVRLADAGAMLNQVILSRNNPLGDVLYGVDNTFLTRALNEDLFVPYQSPNLDTVPEMFQLDAEEYRVTPVAYGDVCLNYDAAYFEDMPLPESLLDLTDPAYESLLVVQNPAASSPGLAFLLATIAVFGEDGDYTYLDYWADLVANDVLVVDGWTEAYYGEFSAGSENGERPLVVSYASSPPVEVLFAEEELEAAPTGAIVADETCFRQVEFAGILEGTEKVEAAQQWIDFMLSETFQEDLPLQMFVFPVNEDAALPELFTEYAAIPENPVTMNIELIEENRETWIEAWTQTVLR